MFKLKKRENWRKRERKLYIFGEICCVNKFSSLGIFWCVRFLFSLVFACCKSNVIWVGILLPSSLLFLSVTSSSSSFFANEYSRRCTQQTHESTFFYYSILKSHRINKKKRNEQLWLIYILIY